MHLLHNSYQHFNNAIEATQVLQNGTTFITNALHLGLFADTGTSCRKSNKPKQAIQINLTSFSAFRQPWCNTAMLKSVHHIASYITKMPHIYPFTADMTWVKRLKELSAQKRWKAPIQHERKDKIGLQCCRAQCQHTCVDRRYTNQSPQISAVSFETNLIREGCNIETVSGNFTTCNTSMNCEHLVMCNKTFLSTLQVEFCFDKLQHQF